jgi:hypothetical protein
MCTHKKSEHKGKFGFISDCKKCQCMDFIRENRPDRDDKVGFFIGVIIIGISILFIIAGVSLIGFVDIDSTEKITIPVTDYLLLGSTALVLAGLMGCDVIYRLFVGEYLTMRKRKRKNGSV